MSLVPFDQLPDGSRLWCFAAARPPTPVETARLLNSVQAFVGEWTAHSHSLRAGMDWRLHRFLLIAVDESDTAAASGCSIDTLTRHLRQVGAELDLPLLDSSSVWFRDRQGEIESCAREEFRRRAVSGTIDETTPVFDITITRLGDFRAGRFEQPAGRSWHRSFLPRS